MNRALLLLCILLTPVMGFAQAPSTQPAPKSLSDSTILILPIEPPMGSYSWVGRAIQQDMLVDLTQITRAHVLAPSSSPVADSDAVLKAGKDARADFVVFGFAQTSATQLRVTGQVMDVATGHTLANLKATAPADDLFPLEDALSFQVARALPGSPIPSTQPSVADAAQTMPQVINQQPYISEVTPAPQYDTGNGLYGYQPYPYAYSGWYYPGWYYPWGGFWWGTGVVIVGHHFHDDHFHGDFNHFHGGFDHRPFVSPHVNPGVFSHGSRGNAGFGGMHAFGGGRAPMGGAHGGFGGMAGHAGGCGMGGGMRGH